MATGDPIDYFGEPPFIMQDVEIVDLSQEPQVKGTFFLKFKPPSNKTICMYSKVPCFKPADYPVATYGAFGAFVDGAP